MSKSELSRNAKNIHELLKGLPTEVPTKCDILIYIFGNFSKLEKIPSHKIEHLNELCKVLIDEISGETCSKRLMEICDNLLTYMFQKRQLKLNFFEKLLEIDKRRRLMIFLYLDSCSDEMIKSLVVSDGEVLHFLTECMQSVKNSTMPWLDAKNAENAAMLINAERMVLPEEQEREEKLVHYALSLLARIYQIHTKSPEIGAHAFSELLMDKVMTLVYMGHKRQRTTALKVLQQALECNANLHVQQSLPEAFNHYKENLKDKFCPRMKLLVASMDLDWTQQWCCSVRFLSFTFRINGNVKYINTMLSVQERAFKSSDTNVRLQALNCWNLLIDHFTLNSKNLPDARKIKVLCTPLNVNSKTELITMKKVEVWWHLINYTYKYLAQFTDEILIPFLRFCFGPLGDTPLLSIKTEINPSPGKQFDQTKIASIDALLQLLVFNQKDLNASKYVLNEKLPGCIDQVIFEQAYKPLMHSVAEAFFMLQDLSKLEQKPRKQIADILWENLMLHVERTSKDIKENVYAELLIVVTELCRNVSTKTFLKSIFMDCILLSLGAHAAHIIANDNTLFNLFDVIVSTINFNQMTQKHHKALRNLLQCVIKSKAPSLSKVYSTKTLEILSLFMKRLQSECTKEDEDAIVTYNITQTWCTIAELATDYMEDSQNINEGNSLEHNFKTIRSIVNFPIEYLVISESLDNFLVAVKVWRNLFKQYDFHTHLIITVKTMEIVNDVVKSIEENYRKRCERWPFIAHILCLVVNTINHDHNSSSTLVATIIRINNEIICQSFEKNDILTASASLKTLNSILTLINKYDKGFIQAQLKVLKLPLVVILKYRKEISIEGEITMTWKKVVNLVLGLKNLFNEDFLNEFREVIALAVSHENDDIMMLATELMNIDNTTKRARNKLLNIFTETRLYNRELHNEENKQSSKIFFNANTHDLNAEKSPSVKNKVTNKEKLKPTEISSDPDTQDFVVINADFNFDYNRLTDHQKEVFKRRRDDIPALYNDLSQSNSQDSNEIQHWFQDFVKQFEQVNKVSQKDETSPNIPTDCQEDQLKASDSQVNSSDFEDGVIPSSQISNSDKLKPSVTSVMDVEQKNVELEETSVIPSSLVPEDDVPKEVDQPKSEKPLDDLTSNIIKKPVKRKAETDIEEPIPAQRRRASDDQVMETNERNREMERLKIDMIVDDSPSTVRRKPKIDEDFIMMRERKRTRRSLNLLPDKTPLNVETKKRGRPAKKSLDDASVENRQNTQMSSELTNTAEKIVKDKDSNNTKSMQKKRGRKTKSLDAVPGLIIGKEIQDLKAVLITKPTIVSSATIIAEKLPVVSKEESKPTNPSIVQNFAQTMVIETVVGSDGEVAQDEDAMQEVQQLTNAPEDNVEDDDKKLNLNQKTRVPRNALRGRAAQMLGLVTKEAIVEIERTIESKKEEDRVKKDKTINNKESERMESPSGTRQEKIFKNMRDELLSPVTSKLFNNVKIDGEKISPKMDKLSTDKDDENKEETTSLQENDSQLLPWSSANPPSLNASPSVSILKRSKKDLIDAEIESTSSGKRKRVSFADPPVSRKMHYELTLNDTPRNINRANYSKLRNRRATPYKKTKLKFNQVDSSNSSLEETIEEEEVDSANLSSELLPTDTETSGKAQHENEITKDLFTQIEVNEAPVKVNANAESQQDIFDEIDETSAVKISSDSLSTTVAIEDAELSNNKLETSQMNLDGTVQINDVVSLSESSSRCSTLPVTNSIFTDNSTFSIDSQEMHVEALEPTSSVYPNLEDCDEPIERIVGQLTNPLWAKHLTSILIRRDIKTIGNLASLTEPEINRLPVKGSSKATFVRNVLERFEKESKAKQSEASSLDNKDSEQSQDNLEPATESIIKEFNSDYSKDQMSVDEIKVETEACEPTTSYLFKIAEHVARRCSKSEREETLTKLRKIFSDDDNVASTQEINIKNEFENKIKDFQKFLVSSCVKFSSDLLSCLND